jgi:tRNA U38,U39,U40 pseudouridine synthase TruA
MGRTYSVRARTMVGFPATRDRGFARGWTPVRTMARTDAAAHALTMTMQLNMKQRDLVRLAVLMCADRPRKR